MICWSFGGGIQSAAIGVLIRQGRLPVPDLAVIADTSRERRTTWDYLRDVMQPYLDPVGLKIQVAPHTLARVDLYAPDGLTIMPAWTEEGRLPSFCSHKWKRRVVHRWLREQGVEKCDCWIGYSVDEWRRCPKKQELQWLTDTFPLIDLFINRAMCQRIIEDAGLPLPHKSRCWQCPHQTPEEWLEVQADPEEWAAAVALEKQMQANDPEEGGATVSELCPRAPGDGRLRRRCEDRARIPPLRGRELLHMTETTLPCGCVVLATADGWPVCMLRPCAEYPADETGDVLAKTRMGAAQAKQDRATQNRRRRAKTAAAKGV